MNPRNQNKLRNSGSTLIERRAAGVCIRCGIRSPRLAPSPGETELVCFECEGELAVEAAALKVCPTRAPRQGRLWKW